jgi:hypothetical protein
MSTVNRQLQFGTTIFLVSTFLDLGLESDQDRVVQH